MFSFRTTPIQDQLDKALNDGLVGCFCTPNSWDIATGKYLWEHFQERGNLSVVFSPQSGEMASSEGGEDGHILFDISQLQGLSAVVAEIQDVGVRYFPYTRDVMRLMAALKELGDDAPALYIVDHINPAGREVEGSIPFNEPEDFTPRTAHRHGLTLGELCNLYYSESGATYPLHVISALASPANRQLMPWQIAPSADITGMFSSYLYSGGGLWSGTSLTPGTGTPRPYEYIGAPFVKPLVAEILPQAEGALLRPCSFTPSYGKYAGERCFGFQIMPTSMGDYHSLLHTLQLMRWFSEHYSQFEFAPDFCQKLSDPVVEEYLKGSITFDIVQEHIKGEEQKWIRKAKRFLLYDDQPYRIK